MTPPITLAFRIYRFLLPTPSLSSLRLNNYHVGGGSKPPPYENGEDSVK